MSEYRMVFLDAETMGDIPNINCFQQLGSYVSYNHTLPEQIAERIEGCEIVITNKVRLDAETIESAQDLRLICVSATGTDNVNLEAAERRGVAVKNVKDYSTHSVAQLTISLMLQLLHRLDYFDDYVKSGKYSDQKLFSHFGHQFWQLEGRQLGIVGLGNIGQKVARIAEALGARVKYYSTSGKNTNQDYPQISLNELLTESDIVSIHAPLTDRTRNLIARAELSSMQKHALLVNTSRGGIVNEPDLAGAIDQGLIGGAAIDVYCEEPVPADHPYLRVNPEANLILTPHIGWASVEARTLLIDRVYQNIEQFIAEQK